VIFFFDAFSLFLCTHCIPSSEHLHATNASQWPFYFSSAPVNIGIFPCLISSLTKFFMKVRNCVAIFFKVQSLTNSSDSAESMKLFFNSCQSCYFSPWGTTALCSFALFDFHNLKLIGIWSLTRRPHCLMYFPAALARIMDSPSCATSVLMYRPSNLLVGPRLPLLPFSDSEGYK
jgi:hypothetical protein